LEFREEISNQRGSVDKMDWEVLVCLFPRGIVALGIWD